jgi:hypothetical protein
LKARTQSAKVKAKRGRPRKDGVLREPNGRAIRSDQNGYKLAVEARARTHKLSVEDAADPQAGTFIGRLHLAYLAWKKKANHAERTGRKFDVPQPAMSLSTANYYAALTFQEVANDYAKAVQSPGAYYEHRGLGTGDEEAAERWAMTACARRKKAMDIVLECWRNNKGSRVMEALEQIVLRDRQCEHLVGDLRIVLSDLNRHF